MTKADLRKYKKLWMRCRRSGKPFAKRARKMVTLLGVRCKVPVST